MYQDRQEDLDPKVTTVLNEGPRILEALESTNEMLKAYYDIKEEKSVDCIHVGVRNKLYFENYASASMQWINPNGHPSDWDYGTEYKESLRALNNSVLDAYITFLECERESLIRRWNGLAKELKK